MANIIQRRRGTTADHVAFTGSEGEITIDLDKETVVVHDAILAGGYPLAREDMSNVLNRIGVAQLSLSEGTDGQVLQTNGSGVISFTNQPNIGAAAVGGDISGTVGNAQIVVNSIGVDELNLQEGTPGQVLQTNGFGVISFESSVDISSSGVGGDLSGTVGNAQIVAGAVGDLELALNAVTQTKILDGNVTDSKLGTDAVTTIKIIDDAVTNPKIVSMSATKLTGALPPISGFALTIIDPDSHIHIGVNPYDISFLAGYDIETLPVDVVIQSYAEMVMARTGTFEGEVGYIDTLCSGTAVICDVLINTGSGWTSIYSTKPQFAIGAAVMTSGTLTTTDFASGNRVRFSVTQAGSSAAGQGVRFMLKCKV